MWRGGRGEAEIGGGGGGGGVRTSGPTPVSESDIEAVAQMCGESAVTVRRVWAHVEVRKGKERSR